MCCERRRSRSGCSAGQRFELAHHVAVAAEREVGLDPRFERGQAELLEPRTLAAARTAPSELGQRGPAPERQRLAEPVGRLLGIALRPAPARASANDALEPGEVELVRLELEGVARRARVQLRGGQHLAQLRDVDLHHLLRGLRDVLAPEVVDDPVERDRAVGVEEQEREERPLLACRDLQRRMTIEHLQRAEQAKVHLETRSTLPRRPRGGSREPYRGAGGGARPARSPRGAS